MARLGTLAALLASVWLLPRPSSAAPEAGPPATALEDLRGHIEGAQALEGFFTALSLTEQRMPGAVTRVLHMGDSSIGLDGLPHALRRRMQGRFGDAGAGFVLLDRASKNYRNRVVSFRGAQGWKTCYIAYLCKADGRYGLGGHTFRGAAGASTTLSTTSEGLGSTVSRFELWYLAQPRGGRVGIRVDEQAEVVVETSADAPRDAWHAITMSAGPHRIRVRALGHGRIRLYGAVLENDGPGVVWDTISMIGAFTKRLHGYDPEHIAQQVDHRDTDLLVLNYGGNDLRRFVTGSVTAAGYRAELRTVIQRLRAQRPDLSCLVVSVIDHGRSGQQLVRAEHMKQMVQAQRDAAFEQGCAFFDSVAAMGGPGSLKQWRTHRPPWAEPDLKHLNARGRDRMGAMMFDALMRAYRSWKAGTA